MRPGPPVGRTPAWPRRPAGRLNASSPGLASWDFGEVEGKPPPGLWPRRLADAEQHASDGRKLTAALPLAASVRPLRRPVNLAPEKPSLRQE